MTNEANTLKLFQGDDRPQAQLQQQLAQLDKAANTKGWYILTLSGSLLTASKNAENWKLSDGKAIIHKILQQREGISIVTKSVGSTPPILLLRQFIWMSRSSARLPYKWI